MTETPIPRAVMHSRRATGYLVLGLIASLLPAPYSLVAVAPLLAATVESVRTLRAMRGPQVPRGARAWTGVGLVLTVALLTSVLLPHVPFGPGRDYRDCVAGANTQVAEQDCAKLRR